MRKKLSLLIVVIALPFVLAACGGDSINPNTDPDPNPDPDPFGESDPGFNDFDNQGDFNSEGDNWLPEQGDFDDGVDVMPGNDADTGFELPGNDLGTGDGVNPGNGADLESDGSLELDEDVLLPGGELELEFDSEVDGLFMPEE